LEVLGRLKEELTHLSQKCEIQEAEAAVASMKALEDKKAAEAEIDAMKEMLGEEEKALLEEKKKEA